MTLGNSLLREIPGDRLGTFLRKLEVVFDRPDGIAVTVDIDGD